LAVGEVFDGDDLDGVNFDGEGFGEALLEGELWNAKGVTCSIVSNEETADFL
jgi:hypothetical protein